ncbi:MAG: hypothetical protein AAGO57_01950 [Pseudomonadota bacterium]
MAIFIRGNTFALHIVAALLSLGLAYGLSTTDLVQTGVQFMAPTALIFATHLAWQRWRGPLQSGFSRRVFFGSLITALGLAGLMFTGSLVAPKPANANVGEVVSQFLGVIFCIAILVAVAAVIFGILYLLSSGASAIYKSITPSDDDDNETRLFDFGAMGVASIAMLAAGLEGLPSTYRFHPADHAEITVAVERPEHVVWSVMEDATQPYVPLPAILASFPQPVGLPVDEGTKLGARREVLFEGREGAGRLSLQVTERTQNDAVFTVLSDTTPFAEWIAFRQLTYSVDKTAVGAELRVRLDYERELSPTWFFGPLMRGSAYFAVRVLANDVRARAELVK